MEQINEVNVSETKYRGRETMEVDGHWYYSDTMKLVSDDVFGVCGHCGLDSTEDDYDGCMGKLDGVMNSCCGHGNNTDAYVQFWGGSIIAGEDAVIIQNVLRRRKSKLSNIKKLYFLVGNCRWVMRDIRRKNNKNVWIGKKYMKPLSIIIMFLTSVLLYPVNILVKILVYLSK